MEKIKPLPWETSLKQTDELENEVKVNNYKRKPKKRKFQGYKEDPFIFLSIDDPVWPEIRYLIVFSFIKFINIGQKIVYVINNLLIRQNKSD